MRKFLSFTLFGILTLAAGAQDSGTPLLRELTQELESKLEREQYEASVEFVQKNLDVFLTAENDAEKAGFAMAAGDAYHFRSKFLLSDEFFESAESIYHTLGDSLSLAETHFALAENARFLGDYEKALRHAYRALSLFQGAADTAPESLADLNGFIARVFVLLKRFDEAEELTRKVNAYYFQLDDPELTAIAQEDLGYLFLEMGRWDSAEVAGKKSFGYFDRVQDAEGLITSSQLMARISIKKGLLREALEYLDLGIRLIGRSEDKRSLHDLYMYRAEALHQLNKHQQASAALDSFYRIGTMMGERSVAAEYYRRKAEFLAAQNRFEDAFAVNNQYLRARDSLDQIANQEIQDELVVRYAISERERELELAEAKNQTLTQENALLENEKELTRTRIWFWALLAAVAVLTAISWLLRSRARIRKEKELTQARLEVERSELEKKQLQLKQYTTNLLEKNRLIDQFEAELSTLRTATEKQEEARSSKLAELYQMRILTNDDWRQYRALFSEVHPHFLTRLQERYPELSEADQRYLMLTKLGMDQPQMADLLGISPASVRVTRHRLRKKLGTDRDLNLAEWLRNTFSDE